MESPQTGLVIPVVAGMLLNCIIFMFVFFKNYVRVAPNEALIVAGRPHQVGGRSVGFRVVKGGGTFVWPLLERASRLSLEVRPAKTTIKEVLTADAVPLELEVSLQYRIGGDAESIMAAAERFLSAAPSAIDTVVNQTVEGILRGFAREFKAEEAWKNSARFAEETIKATGGDLRALGLEIVSLKIDSMKDKDGYLQLVGEMAVAEIKKNAEIAKAKMEEEMARVTADYEKRAAEVRAMGRQVLQSKATPCPSCRAENQPHFKFCSSCGKPLS
jgi:flotillin